MSNAWAVPNCNQLTGPGFCTPLGECARTIQFAGECEGNLRQWRCVWSGTPQCEDPLYGPWMWCNCIGGGCDCLLAGTEITLANGRKRPIETIRVGDIVLSWDVEAGVARPSEVTAVHAPYEVEQYLVINGAIRVTENHPVLSEGRWVNTGELEPGAWLTGIDGLDTPVASIERVRERATVYNFEVAAGTYFANDIIVHNKEDCLEYQQAPCFDCEE